MIDWREIEELPGDLAPGRSFLFCTLGKHIFPVTLVVRNGEALCCSRDNAGANAAVLLEEDALVTHFAEAELPQASERQITAAVSSLPVARTVSATYVSLAHGPLRCTRAVAAPLPASRWMAMSCARSSGPP